MPQRLMLAPSPESAEPGRGSDEEQGFELQDLRPLRRQVWEIIDGVLNGTAPEGVAIRENLRHYVSRNPGRPERALLLHLMSLPGRSDLGVHA